MIESVTMFRAKDGKTFSDEISANRYEFDSEMKDIIVRIFPDRDKLASGDFYQLTPAMITHAKARFCAILRDRFKDEAFAKAIDAFEEDTRNNFVGRLLCDSDSPLYGAWMIFESTDDKCRMFNQPYYANHPDNVGKQIPID